MRPSEFQLQSLAMLVASALVCAPSLAAPVAPAKAASVAKTPPSGITPCNRVEMGPVIRLSVGKSTLIRPPSPITRLLLGNPKNTEAARPSEDAQREDEKDDAMRSTGRPGAADLDVLLLSPNEIYLLGKTIGSTNIVLLDRAGQCTMIDVVVGMDTAALNASLKDLMPAESRLKITSAADSLVLSGMVTDSVAADRVVDIANAYVRTGTATRTTGGAAAAATSPRIINLLEVGAPQQVMLEVKVAEISKKLLDQYGINFTRAYSSGDGSMVRFLSGLFGGNGLIAGQLSGATNGTVGLGMVASVANGSATVGNTVPAGSASIGGTTTTVPQAVGQNSHSLGVDAQKQDGLVKILAEPTVMAISGQEGSFLAGGKIFIPVSTNNGSAVNSITLEEKEFGVGLKFTPTVLSGGRINLKVNPEVSELSAQGVTITSVNTAGTSILPAFTTRRASTTVQLMDGQSFAIGGLIKNNVSSSITAFPFLGELPIIGALFRSTSFQTDRSELVFIITPRLVKPLPANYPLPTDAYVEPSRYDMIMDGKQEGPRKDDSPRSREVPVIREEVGNAPAPGGFEVK